MTHVSNFYTDTFFAPLSAREKICLATLLDCTVIEHPVSTTDIMEWLGTNEPARARVFVSKIRRKIAGTGWTISTNAGGAHSFGEYRVVREPGH